MATDDIISRINDDNPLAQRVRCGGCSVPMAQNSGPISEANLIPIKNKKIANTDKQAVGLLCNTCLNDKARKEEGPRTAVSISPTTDQITEIFYDNLVDSTGTVPLEGTEVSRSDTTGKLTTTTTKKG